MRADRVPNRRGSVLIEVLVALVLLAISGTALVALLAQTAASMRSMLMSEQRGRDAAQEMNRVVMLPRSTLLESLGRRAVGRYTIDVVQVSATLFAVSVAESDTSASLLHTMLYRPAPDSTDAGR